MGDGLGDLLFRDAVLFRAQQVVAEGFIRQPLGHQCDDGHQRAVAQAELRLPAPDLAKEHVIVQLRKFRRESAQLVAASRLFYSHVENLLHCICCGGSAAVF